MKAVNEQSVQLGIVLTEAMAEICKVRNTYANARQFTRVGFQFETTTALINNVNYVMMNSSKRLITDRAMNWLGNRNDTQVDLIDPNDACVRFQAKCCASAKGTLAAITTANSYGGAKYEGINFAICHDQINVVNNSLIKKIKKLNKQDSSPEFSVDSEKCFELPGYLRPLPCNRKIYPLIRAINAYEGVKNANLVTPSYFDTVSIAQTGTSSSLNKTIRKANAVCIKKLVIRNASEDLLLDLACITIRAHVPEDIIIRLARTSICAAGVGILTHELGLQGIKVTKAEEIALTTMVRVSFDVGEAVFRQIYFKNENRTLMKLKSEFFEESLRMALKLGVACIKEKNNLIHQKASYGKEFHNYRYKTYST